jgi:hypothetical protein
VAELAGKALDIGAVCLRVVSHEVLGGPTDPVTFEFDGVPDDAALDAAIAAYPSIAPGVTGSFAVAKGSTYKVYEAAIQPGGSHALDIHVHATLGDASGFDSVYLDYYVLADRFSAGDVRVGQPAGTRVGTIPSFDLQITGTATTVQVFIKMAKAGTLTLIENDIHPTSRGVVP